MSTYDLPRKLVAEALGSGLLVCTVVGSGIMADALSDDVAVSLLGNTIPTGAILVVLITILGPISGAHFNPAVSFGFTLRRQLPWTTFPAYVTAQVIGGFIGTWIAHLMFGLDVFQTSATVRSGGSQWFAEVIATFGLMAVILGGLNFRHTAVPWLVGLYITAAYWFTASTSFANPAVAVARAFTDTFSGIRPADLSGFVAAEFAGAAVAVALMGWLLLPETQEERSQSGAA